MSARPEDRPNEPTMGRLIPGEYVAVNIDSVSHCVGLYITTACQAIRYDSDGNSDYACALTSIDIGDGVWEVVRVTPPCDMI